MSPTGHPEANPLPVNDPAIVNLSLVSHTNVGKTTLARTLLGRDVGEVRDEAHVTDASERHAMVATAAGERLELWDTPGFGDSVKLGRRLAQAGNPIGWFMTEVWDRFRDRAFWSSQHAVRNVLEHADVVLYLVNAAEPPEDAAYLQPELQVLSLIGKPVIVLLNQLGEPRAPADEAAEIERWRRHVLALPLSGPAAEGDGARFRSGGVVRQVLALDAFARCWVQEGVLLRAVAAALPDARRPVFERLREAWGERERGIWLESMAVLAERLERAAADRESVPDAGWSGRLREVGAALGLRREGAHTPRELAMQALAERLDLDVRTSTDRLIALHGLDGHAGATVLQRLAEHYAVREPLNEGKAAVLGGVVSGALAGLKADVASGGLTMGGGLLAGGVLGALGALGLARGYNLVRGLERPTLAWTVPVLDSLMRASLLAYLSVAHYGRGRGEWAEAEHPSFWADAVDTVMQERQEALHPLWQQREGAAAPTEAMRERLRAGLAEWLQNASRDLLDRLYPDADVRPAMAPGPAASATPARDGTPPPLPPSPPPQTQGSRANPAASSGAENA